MATYIKMNIKSDISKENALEEGLLLLKELEGLGFDSFPVKRGITLEEALKGEGIISLRLKEEV